MTYETNPEHYDPTTGVPIGPEPVWGGGAAVALNPDAGDSVLTKLNLVNRAQVKLIPGIVRGFVEGPLSVPTPES